jgi:hypothetical protein
LELLVVLTADSNASLELGMANSQGGDQDKAQLVHFICQQNKGVSLSNFNKIF